MVYGRCQNCVRTPGGRTPLHVGVVLNKTVCDQMLKLLLHIGLTKKLTGRERERERQRERDRETERERDREKIERERIRREQGQRAYCH